MTDTIDQRNELVEAITKEVLAALGGGAPASGASGSASDAIDPCDTCESSCAASCSTKVRQVVAGGAERIEYHGPGGDVPIDLASYIDHTLLKPDASAADIDKICDEAAEHHFASVCVNTAWVPVAKSLLASTKVMGSIKRVKSTVQ